MKSLVEQLKQAWQIGDDILKSKKLRTRTKNLLLITDPKLRERERRRQNFSKYVGERFEAPVLNALRSIHNNQDLLRIYNYIDLADQSKTSANILELQMAKVLEIIGILEKNPKKYRAKMLLADACEYHKRDRRITEPTAIITFNDEVNDLISYLWGKRRINYRNHTDSKLGRGLSVQSILHNTHIKSNERLKDLIDSFNASCKNQSSNTRIKKDRKTKLVQLVVYDLFRARD